MHKIPRLGGGWACAFCKRGGVSAQQEAIPDYGTPQGASYLNSPNTIGFGFTPSKNISVTSLGFSQSGLANLSFDNDSVPVHLWDNTGDLLSTATITTSDPTFNQSYYQQVSPLELYAGDTYFLGATMPEFDTWTFSLNETGNFSVSSDIKYLGLAIGVDVWEGLRANTTADLFEGLNFQYTSIPEPSVLVLGGIGLAATALMTRKTRL